MAAPSQPCPFPLVAYRWQPFDDTLILVGVNLTRVDAMTLEVREFRDAPGGALIALELGEPTVSGPPDQGLSYTVTFKDLIPTSRIRIAIDEATINALRPFPDNGTEPNDLVRLWYGLKLSGGDYRKARWFEESFSIVPGANQS